jgi:hypothetical protein
MPKPVPPQRGPQPDPMAGIVDRLLAQLPGLQDQPQSARVSPRNGGSAGAAPIIVAGSSTRSGTARGSRVLSMWIRVLLGLTLALTMGSWPYSRECGLPLFGYFAAVSMVVLAGIWASVASWRQRGALAHVISLIVIFYGILLSASELLPRTGYAVQRATWACQELGSTPSVVLSQVSRASAGTR